MNGSGPLVELVDVRMHFPVKGGFRGLVRERLWLKAVDGVSLRIDRGETFGLVGESGCGKSTTGKMIVRLLRPTSGRILFEGRDIFTGTRREYAAFSKNAQIVFQDPFSSLDPRFTVGRTIMEPLQIAGVGTRSGRRETVLRLLSDVGLDARAFDKYPHEFSGGQKQRIGVARALAINPALVVCDEPVSALDVSVQAQILNLMQDLQGKYGLTYFFISHNMGVVRHLCDRIAVMYLGKIVELADNESLFSDPLHPYTKALLEAIPVPDPKAGNRPAPVSGDVPSPVRPPEGCGFHPRCPHVTDLCRSVDPGTRNRGGGRMVRCHLYPDIDDRGGSADA